MKKIDIHQLDNRMTYKEYLENMLEIQEQGVQHEIGYDQAMVEYNRLNIRRMQRWDKKLKIDLTDFSLNQNVNILVLTEGWCGDAAHVIPVIHQFAEMSEKINLCLIHRDRHLEIMDAFLTNGGRSIPKAILLDDQGKVLGSWGPRPEELQRYFLEERGKGQLTNEELKIEVQKWYNKDKGQTTAGELKSWLLQATAGN